MGHSRATLTTLLSGVGDFFFRCVRRTSPSRLAGSLELSSVKGTLVSF